MPTWPERAMPAEESPALESEGVPPPDPGGTAPRESSCPPSLNTAHPARSPLDRAAAERRARASIAFGRKRGYYRVLFEAGPVDAATFAELAGVPEHHGRAWLDEQLAAGVLRVVDAPDGDGEELLLPGEFVPVLLGDHGEPELEGARALLAEHRAEVERVRAFADAARLTRVV